MSTSRPTSFAELLKRHRLRARLSQEELAERAGLSVRAISNLERGLNRGPRQATIRLLVAALALSEAERVTFEAVAHGEAAAAPGTAAHRPGLPVPPTPLIGREKEVATLRSQVLRPDVRLLTLLGAAGAGKTRLALRVAEEVAPAFADGVAFVALGAIADADLVCPTIARALGLGETPDQLPIERLEDYLRDQQLLLVLDNFEQVARAAGPIAMLLQACPRLKVLVTSRVVLHLSAEHAYVVPPLASPEPAQGASPAALSRYAAVQLFVARTRAAKPEFALTAENAAAVGEICRRLDGLPLAVELAAARARLLSPQAMLPRLDHRLTLLTEGPLDVPARQRTLRATLDWSYNLLDQPAQRLLCRLAAFPAGCTLETVAALYGPEEESLVLEHLAALVDGSLLREEESPGGETRFLMLETIREYALARLAESGEEGAVRRRQAQHYLGLVGLAAPGLAGPDQVGWLRRLEAEHDNLRATLAWSLGGASGAAGAELGRRLAVALWPFWEIHGYLSEGRRWLARVVEGAEQADAPGATRRWWAEAFRGAGVLAQRQGDYPAARDALTRSLAQYRQLGDERGIATALNDLGRVALDRADYAGAQGLHEQSLALCRTIADARGIAAALSGLGTVAYCLADYGRARALLSESLALGKSLGDKRGVATVLHRLSSVARYQGKLAEARTLAEESLTLRRELGDRWGIAYSLNTFGNVARDLGDYDAAVPLLRECRDLQWHLGDKQGYAYSLHQLGLAARAQGELLAAQRLARESLVLFRELGHRRGVAYALTALGAAAREDGDGDEARRLLGESLRTQQELGDKRGIANALEELAALAIARGEPDEAARLLGAVAALRGAIGDATVPVVGRQYDARVAAARGQLAPDRFAACWAEGSRLPVTEIVARALARAEERAEQQQPARGWTQPTAALGRRSRRGTSGRSPGRGRGRTTGRTG